MAGGVSRTVGTRFKELDKLDIEIIVKLLNDSRTPFRQLARELGVGESTVYMRVKKLKDMGVLKGFTACIDLNRLGFVQQAYIEIKVTPQYLRSFVEELIVNPNVLEIHEISGEYPLLVRVAAMSSDELTSTIDKIALIKGVTEINVKYVFKTLESEGLRKTLASPEHSR